MLSSATLERRADAVALVCAVLGLRAGEGSLACLRCRTIEARLNALEAPAGEHDAALARFVAARTHLRAVVLTSRVGRAVGSDSRGPRCGLA